MNEIARAKLGTADTPRLVLEGLKTRSTAWATPGGRLRAVNKVSSAQIRLVNLEETPVEGTPLDDLLDAAEGGINEVLATLIENGDPIEIPGLGTVDVGFDRLTEKRNFAVAGSFVLKVDALRTRPGRRRRRRQPRRHRPLPRPHQPRPAGRRHVRRGLGRQRPGARRGRARGPPRRAAAALPWHRRSRPRGPGRRAELRQRRPADRQRRDRQGLRQQFDSGGPRPGRRARWPASSSGTWRSGPSEVAPTSSRARSGKIVTKNIAGSRIGEILVDGESQGALTPGNVEDAPEIEIPGVADVEFFVTEKGRTRARDQRRGHHPRRRHPRGVPGPARQRGGRHQARLPPPDRLSRDGRSGRRRGPRRPGGGPGRRRGR